MSNHMFHFSNEEMAKINNKKKKKIVVNYINLEVKCQDEQ